MQPDYDVIIVGGRPAGAGLAHRLGKQGRRVLVLDRQRFPCWPNVPSSPAVHMGTLALLDEIGIAEADIAAISERFGDYVLRFGTWFEAPMRITKVHGRTYGYGVRRTTFDGLLWQQLEKWPTVSRREGFAVEALIRDASGAVIGVEGKVDGVTERHTATWVIGADSRFSTVARLAGAKILEQHDEKASTVYLADWEGVAPRVPGARSEFEVYTDGRGTDLLLLPMPGGLLTITTHQRADIVDVQGDAEAYYRAVVARYPSYAQRFANARMTGRVVGLKKVGNGYRDPSGDGWALVGDAFHFKDPVDGQGIYDALLSGRILAEELDAAFEGRHTHAEAGKQYGERAIAATHPMFEATLGRLSRELYGPPPNPVVRTVLRWLFTDPVFQDNLFRFFGRDPAVDPLRWQSPSLVAGCLLRGLGRDIAGVFARRRALPGPRVDAAGG